MKTWIYYISALLVGFAIVTLGFRTKSHSTESVAAEVGDGTNTKPVRGKESAGPTISRLLAAESVAMDEATPLDEAGKLLYEQKLSPLRSASFLKQRIYLMTREQLERALGNGEIWTEVEIREAASRLAAEDPSDTVLKLTTHKFMIGCIQNRKIFIDGMVATAAEENPLGMLDGLRQMKQGGELLYISRIFCRHLVKADPATYAENFEELTFLRNMSLTRNKPLFRNEISAMVTSWNQTDPEAMEAYISGLPAGEKRKVFETALGNLHAE
ncbi:MAG: hypothetical protein ACSHX7_04640 [Luteolibacter sp.]